ncbi:DUF4365 domain-containing protein [Nonomuraea sp. NPDC026600]|uniref:DUF4365 domain-containing protein n=1 Tax=Nonomuraea sp. NPDC026600 TaxID=3155363 RepID=UPI0033FC3716
MSSDSDIIGQLAVAFTSMEVLGRLSWAFRPQDLLDYGIDAHVEIRDGTVPTGRLLALQIKGGSSWFSEPTANGWIYRPSAKHVNYWLDHSLPVIVVLVDLEERVAYWEHVTHKTALKVKKKYKIEIPRTQTLSTAKAAWSLLDTDRKLRASEQYQENVKHLPPSVASLLDKSKTDNPTEVALLALQLAEGRFAPAFTVQTMLASHPDWLTSLRSDGWCVIGRYASEHQIVEQAAQAYENAAEQAQEVAGKYLALAGLQLILADRSRAIDLLNRASDYPDAQILVAIGQISLSVDPDAALPFDIPADSILHSPTAQLEAGVQALYGFHAQRRGDHNETVLRFSKASELAPDNTHYMLVLAEAFGQRANSVLTQDTDSIEAQRLAQSVLNSRRAWAGGTKEALRLLLRILAIRGDYEEIINVGCPAPIGSGSVFEIQNFGIARVILSAAKALSRTEVIEVVLDAVSEIDGARQLRMEFSGTKLTAEQEESLFLNNLQFGLDSNDPELIAVSATQLAGKGIDRTAALVDYVERGIIAEATKEIAEALIVAHSDFDRALPRLRKLAESDPTSAEQLIVQLAKRGRFGDADIACQRAIDHLGMTEVLALRAEILSNAGLHQEAAAVANEALGQAAIVGSTRSQMHHLAAVGAIYRDDWSTAERNYYAALADLPIGHEFVLWNLVNVLLKRRKDEAAARIIQQYHLSPRTARDARSWFQAMVSQAWNDIIATEALSLVSRFEEDGELGNALLGHIIQRTQDSDAQSDALRVRPAGTSALHPINSSLRAQAFATLADIANNTYREGVTRNRVISLEEFLGFMRSEEAQRGNDVLKHIYREIQAGSSPTGMAATATKSSYSLLLLQRTFSTYQAVVASDEIHDLEIAAALSSLDSVISVEPSALIVASACDYMDDIRPLFVDLQLAGPSRDDITRAVVEARGLTASPGTVSWDRENQVLSFFEIGVEERVAVWRSAERLNEVARQLTIAPVDELFHFDGFSDFSSKAWLAPLELALQRGVSLWSDDAVLRQVAREFGISAFGTAALLEGLIRLRLEGSDEPDDTAIRRAIDEQVSLVRTLMSNWVVDVPASFEDIVAQAAMDSWRPLAGATPLSRGSWWLWQGNPFQLLLALYDRVAAGDPTQLPSWQGAAMAGIAQCRFKQNDVENPAITSAVLAAVALLGYDRVPNVENARDGLKRAASAAESSGLPDPIPLVPQGARLLQGLDLLREAGEFVHDVLREE